MKAWQRDLLMNEEEKGSNSERVRLDTEHEEQLESIRLPKQSTTNTLFVKGRDLQVY